MHLKELKLNGFKSFAQATTLEFSAGITAVVGPNGSGKSNVADAIRWILGEQSMKNIRSQNSKDLIFSGSKKRGKLGKASVSLCFDNQSGRIPLDYSEVIISRNIFRDGVSEYFINKTPSKLIDAAEILAKANIGHKGFSVINQGMESEILKYSPAELYNLIEEASGVRYLQLKKRRSERRLKITQTNLEKAITILGELSPHLKYLKREATKAERREKLKGKLAEHQEDFFSFKANDLKEKRAEAEEKKASLEKIVSKLKNEVLLLGQDLQKEEKLIRESRGKFVSSQKEMELALDKKVEVSEEIANLRAEIQVIKERQIIKEEKQAPSSPVQADKELSFVQSALKKIVNLKKLDEVIREINKIISKLEGNTVEPERKIEKPESKNKELVKLIEKQKELEKKLIEIDKEYQEQKNELRKGQENINQDAFFETEKKLRNKKDSLNEAESQAKEVNWLLNQIEEDWQEFKSDLVKSGIKYEDAVSKKTAKDDSNEENLEETINRLKYKIEEIGSVDEITLQEYQETKERYEKLIKKTEDLKVAKKNLEDLIKELTRDIKLQFNQNLEVINENLNKYFRLLFEGGKATLKKIMSSSKEEEDEVLEGEEALEVPKPEIVNGLEIKARLPGKKIDNLKLFSGGEKALTSIALLFAIISSNPPPFLVLDEVDATLDESNARRFAKLLGEFSKDTQFVVITHNRETMGQADILYGVSMGEDGVSSLISLKLEK